MFDFPIPTDFHSIIVQRGWKVNHQAVDVENPPFDDEFDEFPRRTTRGFPIRTRLGSIRVSQQAPRDTERCAKSEKDGPIGSGWIW